MDKIIKEYNEEVKICVEDYKQCLKDELEITDPINTKTIDGIMQDLDTTDTIENIFYSAGYLLGLRTAMRLLKS
jgi:enolase